eukprot:403353524
MAFNDFDQFEKIIIENGILDLSRFYGYEVPEEFQTLKSGRKVSTLNWNVMTLALVYNRSILFYFLLNDINFNLGDLLDLEKPQNLMINRVNVSESYIHNKISISNRFVQNIQPILQLMLENESPLIKNILNDLACFINPQQSYQILEIISQNSKQHENLEILLQSHFFKQFYYQNEKIKMDGVFQKHSFSSFYENCFKFFESDKQAMEVISKQLSLSPYAASFGIYVISNLKEAKAKFGNLQKIVQTCQKEIRDYDLWKQGDIQEEEMQEIMNNMYSSDQMPLIDFFNSIKDRQFKLKEKVIESIDNFLSSIITGKLNETKGFIDILIPLEDFFNISGYTVEPIFKQNIELLEILLDLDYLWEYEDLQEIYIIIEDADWPEGIQVLLESKAANVIFTKMNLDDKCTFVREFLDIPYFYKNDSMNSSNTSPIYLRDQRFILIQDCLTQSPYTAAYLFQEITNSLDILLNQLENDPIVYDPTNLKYIIKAVETVNTLELSEFIFETKAKMLKRMKQAQDVFNQYCVKRKIENQYHNEMAKQISLLIEKIQINPAYTFLKTDLFSNDDVNQVPNKPQDDSFNYESDINRI